MKVHNEFEQNSLLWLKARAGVVTASEFDNLVTPGFKIKDGEAPKSYLAQKVAEKWTGGPLPGFMTLDMEFGKIREEEAIPFYEFEFSEKVTRAALITDDDSRYGCSPDGLIGEDGGVEVKCPLAKTHVGWLLAGEVPKDHLVQIHFSMLVTGRAWWKFFSYRRGFPAMVKLVERDEKIQRTMRVALDEFIENFDAAMEKMKHMNGGVLPDNSISIRPEPKREQPSAEMVDLIP